MATFISHGLLGAGIASSLVPEAKIPLAIYGFVTGVSPDVIDWAAAKMGLSKRWEIYTRMHKGDLRWMGVLFWPMGLHILVDLVFHRKPGENWWPRLGWLEVTLGLAGLALILWTFIWR